MKIAELTTDRLKLRRWRAEDLDVFAELNGDPRVMEFFPGLLTREQSEKLLEHFDQEIATRGWGLWSVEVVGGAPFIGFIGLEVPGFTASFTPCVEIGWRLAYPFWNLGYATEGARRALRYAF